MGPVGAHRFSTGAVPGRFIETLPAYANAQTIQVEMTLSPQWSALATRDRIFSINLLYKKQFR